MSQCWSISHNCCWLQRLSGKTNNIKRYYCGLWSCRTKEDFATPNWKADSYLGRGMCSTQLLAYGLVRNFTEDLVVENFKAIPAKTEVRPCQKHWNRK